ncbi:hypothetical protein FNV43_RR22757 [Rhamnella rubrinervis]|uniref:DUF1985 domain-containing protein n=1 Tax=Rhamnella rubrinervis TaxID=2594499 RepID=A0A8K0DS39_9ROSA|nr:hypothetical protein FNV43_RR22757 [Rhamnella rubrinervis]
MAPSKRRLVKASEKQGVKPYWHGFQNPCEIAEIQVESCDCFMDWEVFEIKTFQFYGGFIHHLLLHQVECDYKYVMEFDFNGIGARFDRKCFAMITRLNCGEFSKAFKDLDFDEKEVADNVKCCIFYFLETVLLGGDKKRLVRNDNFNIIQNDDLCGRYPWGNLSYDATIASLRSRIKLGREIANYKIWGFETIPIVATIGPRGKYHGSNWILRMLTWSCPSILQYTKLATAIFDRKDDASQSEFQHTSRLEMQIEEIRSELVSIRIEMRDEMRQQ